MPNKNVDLNGTPYLFIRFNGIFPQTVEFYSLSGLLYFPDKEVIMSATVL